jgi:GAF domain-containing protein
MNAAIPLESVLVPLADRDTARPADYASENATLLWLADELARGPRQIFHKLTEAALTLTGAQSAGISLLDAGHGRFVWPAVAGEWAPYAGGTMPRDFSPCGVVLDRNAAQLFRRPERYFEYLARATPRIEEGLLVPFHVDGQAMGTVWAVIHREDQRFDREDERALTSISRFTAAAYRTLRQVGALDHLN